MEITWRRTDTIKKHLTIVSSAMPWDRVPKLPGDTLIGWRLEATQTSIRSSVNIYVSNHIRHIVDCCIAAGWVRTTDPNMHVSNISLAMPWQEDQKAHAC